MLKMNEINVFETASKIISKACDECDSFINEEKQHFIAFQSNIRKKYHDKIFLLLKEQKLIDRIIELYPTAIDLDKNRKHIQILLLDEDRKALIDKRNQQVFNKNNNLKYFNELDKACKSAQRFVLFITLNHFYIL